jgi:hypothetical protein
MRDCRILATLLFFTLVTSVLVFPMTEKYTTEFSLKKCYAPTTIALDLTSRERIIARARQETLQTGVNPVITQIQAEIAHLKKKKNTSLIASIACAVVGGACVYGFATYGEQVESERDDLQDPIKSSGGSRKWLYMAGGATAFAISIALYFDVAKKNRAIKAHEAELKKLTEVKGPDTAGFQSPR